MIPHGKHKGRTLEEVVQVDPNYALHAHATYNWFPKLTPEQIADCQRRYKHKPKQSWACYEFRDYGDGWC